VSRLWGIDLGGTKIEGVVLDGEQVICRPRIATEASKGYEHIVSQIEALVQMLEEETASERPSTIGIGTPGAVDPSSGLMKNCNTTCLNGMPLPTDLRNKLQTEVAIANDANCFALAEATMGAAKGHEVVFGIIMGTGVGGGIVVNARVLNGAQGIAGEWGHNVLEPDGDPCYCGKRGCVETVLSGPALERYYNRLSSLSASLHDITQLPVDPHATKTRQRMVDSFGKAVGTVINILDPDVIVLGGGVSNALPGGDQLRESLKPWVFNDQVRTEIVKAGLGDSAGVFGAAMLSRAS
jgi:predicted NBD/HSP70 family sugar kinase